MPADSQRPPDERTRRRRLRRGRLRRQRTLAATGLLLLTAVGAAVAVAALNSTPNAAATTTKPATQAATLRLVDTAGTITVAGSKANEAPAGQQPTTATTKTLTRGRLRGKTIAIDPGHNGGNYLQTAEINRLVDAGTLRKPCDTTGTETDAGYSEAAYNLDVALRLRTLLRKQGAHVVMTRTTNTGWGPCITERAAIGNRAHADAAISIHADGGPAGGRGFHVIYPPPIAGLTDDIAASSHKLALAIRAAFRDGTGLPYATYIGHNGLDVRSDLGGLNLSNVPKVFIETGNMRNATDAALLTNPAFRQRVAKALAAGFDKFLSTR